jgi:hypothetical protein
MAQERNNGATPLGGGTRERSYSQEADANEPDKRRETAYHRDDREREAREKFGGTNLGAAFFGWIVAIGIAVLLTSIVGAVGAAVGFNGNLSQSDAERQAGTIGIAAAVVLLVVLMVGYYAGGYVAGRMSRYDGGRQGLMVWLIGLLVTVLAVILGAVFGSQYNILDRVSLPRVPVTPDQLGWGAVITGIAVLLLTLLAAVLGGKVGHRYHTRVDRAAGR